MWRKQEILLKSTCCDMQLCIANCSLDVLYMMHCALHLSYKKTFSPNLVFLWGSFHVGLHDTSNVHHFSRMNSKRLWPLYMLVKSEFLHMSVKSEFFLYNLVNMVCSSALVQVCRIESLIFCTSMHIRKVWFFAHVNEVWICAQFSKVWICATIFRCKFCIFYCVRSIWICAL